MNEKQQAVARCSCDVRIAEERVAAAQTELRLTKLKLEADMAIEIAKLEAEVRRTQIFLEKERTYLVLAKAELERGFSQ